MNFSNYLKGFDGGAAARDELISYLVNYALDNPQYPDTHMQRVEAEVSANYKGKLPQAKRWVVNYGFVAAFDVMQLTYPECDDWVRDSTWDEDTVYTRAITSIVLDYLSEKECAAIDEVFAASFDIYALPQRADALSAQGTNVKRLKRSLPQRLKRALKTLGYTDAWELVESFVLHDESMNRYYLTCALA